MDCIKLESAELRRSARQSQNKVFAIEIKPREALKRKRDIKPVPTMEECNTDEGSPDKIPKLQVTKDAEDRPENGDQINTVEMDVEEDSDQNQNMSSEDESENCGEGMKSHLRQLFPSQRPELWKRTEVHVRLHLNLTDPTEPVSLILTSGRGAEKTLRCLAQQLAAAFSNTLNSSVVEIDGTSKSVQDSDQVKLDIDKLLEEAFAGGTQAAVIHRFEELPPGSTLIFYRYCDHENSAFKKVFLVFTVMLPVEELDFKLGLGAVEEQVQEALKEKFVSSDRTAKFNQMDVDKLSGLWSRISHLILPVAAEQKIEQRGCGEDGSL
ncbi:lamina-associated polypeptide 1B isoform X4 [Silurus asotus]|uniref:Lamina-associated polypeptide 1B isoform X4 n=1 Tax=Silurus asotus TaxID=30991 RepID=A0AAD5A5M5_SILAS|nr:lamina-associated polypeptide 1B isoform X4 [Silurus asotus]